MLAACYYVRRYETSHGKLVQNVCDHACGSVCRPVQVHCVLMKQLCLLRLRFVA